MVIVGGRYGSVDAEGLSYTEREYDYAIEAGKPVIGFVHSAPGTIPLGKSEVDPVPRERLQRFRAKVEEKHCKFWKNADDLGGKVSRSLIQLMKDHPAEGWVRGRYAKTGSITEAGLIVQEQYIKQMCEAGYAWLTEVSDSLGNRNVNSWGKGTSGDWSHASITTIHAGDRIVIHAKGTCSLAEPLEYRFMVQRSGTVFRELRDWSTVCNWTWDVTDGAIGRGVVVMISVKRPKSYYQFGDMGDDLTYAIYDILPRAE